MENKVYNKGFTLIEVLMVLGIIAILAAIVLVAINPARQFKQAHDTQRIANINTILNAISQNIAENRGVFMCNGSPYQITNTATNIKNNASGADLAPCLVPTYITLIPFDPTASNAHYTSNTDYDTGYIINQDDITGRITITAVGEITNSISVTR